MNETAREQAYLIERGVRPMALMDDVDASDNAMASSFEALETTKGLAIPFVIPRGDGRADTGYAACPWVVDLMRWMGTDAVPRKQRNRIIGLLLGYSSEAIGRFDTHTCGSPTDRIWA